MREDVKFLLEMGREARNEGRRVFGFIIRGMGKSFYIFGRGVLTPYFMKTLPSILPTTTSLSPPIPIPLFLWLSCFSGWMGDLTKFDMLFYLKLVSAIFYNFFTFSPNDGPFKTMKNVFYFIKKAIFVLKIFKFL